MRRRKFCFRNKNMLYDYNWIDKNTYTLCLDDAEFVDKDGDKYYILTEYHADENSFIFEIWYDYQVVPADETYITEPEKECIKSFMRSLMDNMFISMLAIV